MWQGFTERARRVVFFAQEEAGWLGENYVSTEHLLLGLCRENESTAAYLIEQVGPTLGRVRREIERQVARGDGRLGQDMQLTPRARRVIDLASEEAKELGSERIGTEHILLGLIGEGEGLAGRVLNKLGVDLDRTRRELVKLRTDPDGASAPTQALSSDDLRPALDWIARLERVKDRFTKAAGTAGSGAINPGDLGTIKPAADREFAEIAVDAAAFQRLCGILAAKDFHGWIAMTQGDPTVFLLPAGTPVKILVMPTGADLEPSRCGWYIRVLSGFYEGSAGWIFRDVFEYTGKDEAPFPPRIDE